MKKRNLLFAFFLLLGFQNCLSGMEEELGRGKRGGVNRKFPTAEGYSLEEAYAFEQKRSGSRRRAAAPVEEGLEEALASAAAEAEVECLGVPYEVLVLDGFGKRFRCGHPGCRYSTRTGSHMRDHMVTHLPREAWPFQCPHCDRKFSTTRAVRRHIRESKDHRGLDVVVVDLRGEEPELID
jgi:hypothetical protein